MDSEASPRPGLLSRLRGKDTSDAKEVREPRVGFWSLYRYATVVEKLYVALSILAAAIHGAVMPAMTILFGSVLEEFSAADPATAAGSIGNIARWFLVLGAGSMVVSFIQVRFLDVVSTRVGIRIRRKYFRSLMSQEREWYDAQATGELTARVASDVDVIQAGIGDKVGAATQFMFQFFVGIAVAFAFSWRLSLVVLACAPLLALSGAIFGRIMASSTNDSQGAYAEAGAVANEAINLMKTIHAFSGQEEEGRRYNEKLDKAFKSGVRGGVMQGAGLGFTMLLSFCVYTLAFWYGARLVREGTIGISDLFTAFLSVLIGAQGLGQAAPSFSSFSAAQGAAPRVFEIIERSSSIDPFDPDGEKPMSFYGAIDFRGVTFNYASRAAQGGAPVLSNLNLEIKAGTTHALVGPSGCGKSSTMSLIERFYDVLDGSVCFDGRDARDLNVRWLRSQMGYVGQMPTLFRGTIRENIAYGAGINFDDIEPNGFRRREVTMGEIEEAAKMANAHQFIKRLPEGYDTVLGERGALLSGGQKQRICIARAIVRNPKILLLDEATSALDAQSEHIVQEALERVSEGRTTVIIAHRLSTVRNADTISVFNAGQIVEQGRHDDLITVEGGAYKKLVELQQIATKATEHDEKVDPDAIHENFHKASVHHTTTKATDNGLSIMVDDPESHELPATDSGVVRRTFKFNSSEALYILLGCIGALISGASQPITGLLFADITGILALPNNEDRVTFLSLMFIVVGAITFISHVVQYGFLGLSGESLTRKLRSRAFRALMRQELGYFDKKENAVGSVTARLAREAAEVQSLCGGTLGAVCVVFGAVTAGVGVAFAGCWKLALVVLACLPFMAASAAIQMQLLTGFDSANKKEFVRAGAIATEAVDNCVVTISPLGIEDAFIQQYEDALVTPERNGIRTATYSALSFGVSQFISFAIWAVSFWSGGAFLNETDCTFIGIMRAINGLIFAGMSLRNVSTLAPDAASARVSATNIFRLLDRESNIKLEGGMKLHSYKGSVNMEDGKFEYPTRPHVPVLRGLSFKVEPGKTLALVGQSGCGKSTVTSLLQRFYDLRTGTVLFDEKELKTLDLQAARSNISYVQQEPDLFDRTIRDNIAYGLPKELGTVVTDDVIIEAAKQANAHDFITKLPKQYEFVVGERGGNLSGGMKQRVAIARALVRRPKLLILDEASSALDAVSEKAVQEALDAAREGRTTVVIAHRLSTVKDADAIALLERGKVAEYGTHDELIAKNGKYAELVKHQMSEEN